MTIFRKHDMETSIPIEQQIILWRDKARRGEPMTKDEQREALAAIRKQRVAAQSAAASKATKVKAIVRSADELLGLFGKAQ